MGSVISSGLFGANVALGLKGAGLLWAKNGGLPVGVGPYLSALFSKIMSNGIPGNSSGLV